MSKTMRFCTALVGQTWQNDVEIEVSDDGLIEHIEANVEGPTQNLVALPGMINVHSHAFQRAFVGLGEYQTANHDSFWTWRKLMYDFVSKLTSEDVYVIATQLYQEMLTAGYTWVGEFHYLHNDIGGVPYSPLAETSNAIHRAARDVGIGLCHLPVLYQRGGFDNEPIAKGQDRFILSDEQFVELFQYCLNAWKHDRNVSVGMAIHSLRAVCSQAANNVVDQIKALNPNAPIHIHVAEQTAELDACMARHGMRSVEFLFDRLPVDQSWCLIHATHLNDAELKAITNSKATVGLCPTTEANLGDGIFRTEAFLDAGGAIALGSDSHCTVDFREELRLLEYAQRLTKRRRAILGSDSCSVGRNLYCTAARAGARALGINAGEIAVGKRADFTLIDPNHGSIGNVRGDRILDRLVFSNIGNPVAGVVVGGNQIDNSRS